MSVMLLRQIDKRIDRVQSKLAKMTGADVEDEIQAVDVALAAIPEDADSVRKVLERKKKSLKSKKSKKTSQKGKSFYEQEVALLQALREHVGGHEDYRAGKRGRPKGS